jgi:hypothetical protein
MAIEGGVNMVDVELIEKMLMRGAGLVGMQKMEEIGKKAGIDMTSFSENIKLNLPPEKVLEILIKGLLKEGGVIAKIAVKNMSKQYNFEMPD